MGMRCNVGVGVTEGPISSPTRPPGSIERGNSPCTNAGSLGGSMPFVGLCGESLINVFITYLWVYGGAKS